jgi:hypothetical protein
MYSLKRVFTTFVTAKNPFNFSADCLLLRCSTFILLLAVVFWVDALSQHSGMLESFQKRTLTWEVVAVYSFHTVVFLFWTKACCYNLECHSMNFHHCEDMKCENKHSYSNVTENSSIKVCDAVVGQV